MHYSYPCRQNISVKNRIMKLVAAYLTIIRVSNIDPKVLKDIRRVSANLFNDKPGSRWVKNVREVARGSLEIVKQYLKYLWMRNVFTEVSFKDIGGEGQ